jgi:hypothetical protein
MRIQNQLKWMWVVLLLTFISVAGLTGCGDLFSGFDKENIRNDEDSAVLFAMRGNQIMTSYSEWPIPEGEEPSEVTSRYDFLMLIDLKTGDDNQVRFYGLEGADVGKRDQYLYHDCNPMADCKVIGTLDGEELTIDLQHEGGTFQAEGEIRNFTDSYYTNDFIELTATYTYQETIIEYEFRGEVVIE